MRKSINNFSLALVFLLVQFVVVPTFAVNKVADADMTYWVKDALRQDPRVDVSEMTITTKDGIVTLSGVVANLAAKKYADIETKKINGVRGVVNELVVKPTALSDTNIADRVRRRILNSAAIKSQNIRVSCSNGIVTLKGEVPSWSEEQEASLLTAETRGVRKVTNEIWVEHKTSRSDREIRDDAVASLDRDAYLTGLPIGIAVKEGVVTLAGDVGSAYQKDRASNDIHLVANVRNIKNELRIESWDNNDVRKKKTWSSDEALQNAVKAELKQDTRIDTSDISVRVTSGAVTLSGSVPNAFQAWMAKRDAQDVVGVAWVNNELTVPVSSREDSAIREDVIYDFQTDYALDSLNIDVKVDKGIVTLTGEVHTVYEKVRAESVAARVRGVTRIINRITVNRLGHYPDSTLSKIIKARLKWNWATTRVSDGIEVTVRDGVAKLTGNVETWTERWEAGRTASNTSGICKVDNRLKVAEFHYPWEKWYEGAAYDPFYSPVFYY